MATVEQHVPETHNGLASAGEGIPVENPATGETIATAKSSALSVRIETDLKAAFILAKPVIGLKGGLLPMASFGVSPRLA